VGEADKHSTKGKIIKIALKLIKEKDFDSVTINDICGESNISKHTFYYYFKSKDDIIKTFKEAPYDIKSEALSDILNAENNFEKLWLSLEPMIDYLSEMGAEIVKRIMIMNFLGSIETFSKRFNSGLCSLQLSLIEKGQQDGSIRNGSPAKPLFYAANSAFIGALLFWVKKRGSFDIKEAMRGILETLMDLPKEKRKAKVAIDELFGVKKDAKEI
jgi:AcrR family transcriptional regulator